MKQLSKKSAIAVLIMVLMLSFCIAFALTPLSTSKVLASTSSTLQIDKTAGIRIQEEPYGIRFKSTIGSDEYGENVGAKYGTLICPADYLEVATNDLVHDDALNGALNLYDPDAVYGENETFANYIVDISANPKYNEKDGLYEFYGALVNINEQNIARPFAARSYVAIPNGNGGYSYSYSEIFTSSIYSVATYSVVDKDFFDELEENEQKYLTDMIDSVNGNVDRFNSFDVSIDAEDKTALSVGDIINVTATVKINSSKYSAGYIELAVAPSIVGVVGGVEDETALEYVAPNQYKVATYGDFDIKATLGKTNVKVESVTGLSANSVKLLDLDNLDNGFLTGSTSYNAGLTGKISTLNGAQVTTVDGYDAFSYRAETNTGSFIGLTPEAGQYLKDGTWVVFDMKYVPSAGNSNTVPMINMITSTQTNLTHSVYFTQYRNITNYQRYEFHRIGDNPEDILVDTIPLVEYSVFDLDGETLTLTWDVDDIRRGANIWRKYAMKINADALTDEGKASFGIYFDLGGVPATINIKDMYLTNEPPYSVEISGVEDKTYSDGDKITLTASALKKGGVISGATPTLKVAKGNATISGNVLTVGYVDSIVEASYTVSGYTFRDFVTVKAYSYENLQVTGFDTSKTYTFNEEVTLSATADLGEQVGKTVEPLYELTSGSAVIDDNVVTNIVGEVVITANYKGLTYEINLKGQTIADLAVNLDTTKTYAYDEIVELTATATVDGVSGKVVTPTYTVTSGSAVVYTVDNKVYAKPGSGASTITATLAGLEQEVTFTGETESFMILGGDTEKGLNSKALAEAYLANGAGHKLDYVEGRYAIGYEEGVTGGHLTAKGFNLKDEILALMNKDCYVYIDMLVSGNGETRIPTSGTFFLDVPGTYLYGFEPQVNHAQQGSTFQWYNGDGDLVKWGDNNLKMGSRWLTIEVKASESESALFEISRYANWTTVWVSRIVVSEKQLILDKQAEVAQTRYLMDNYSSFDTYFFPDENQGGNFKDVDSSFTWVEDVAGRSAVKYTSTNNPNNYIGLWLGLKHYNYTTPAPIMPKYTHAYVSFYVPEGDVWNTSTYFYNAWKVSLPNINQSASGTISGITYQWYDDEGNALTSAPTSIIGEWVTVELIRDESVTGANFGIAKNTGGYTAGYNNDVYFSDIIFSNIKLLGVSE